MSLMDILIFLLNRKIYSIAFPFCAGILAISISYIVSPYYKSEIRVRLDTSKAKTASLGSLFKGTATPSSLLGSLGAGAQEDEDLYMEILEGRDVRLAVIEKFKLDTIYKGVKYKEALLKILKKELEIEYEDLTGIVSCTYEAQNKVLARDLVRFAVEEANTMYIRLRKERALQTIEHLNSFRQDVLASVDSSSQTLINFYRDNNLLNLASQFQLTLATLGGYEDQIKNLKISEASAGTNNSSEAELRKRRAILEREFKKLRGEFSKDYLPSKTSVYVNSDWAIEKLIEQERLEGNLKRLFITLEMIEGNIVMEEANAIKNSPVIQIVQDAYLADYKSKPKRAIWGIAATCIAFAFISSLLIIKGIYTGELKSERQEDLKRIVKSFGL